ncbi:DUF4331 family protein [Arcticibacterium luteifluviistationis]|uniref:DUF4331 domain-containing protein n=1 Tax=Arcticibacterium luteifluviistationis TaxID=1784714 RepID=A0A2Z4GFT4_9BACT|nr:DUF4331 family protein [Arcticibacterium luteifluviistationis]AWW00032.1 hypothetical protein DJ013_18400 [Arcticibacterium luteifluviistationis]
MKKILRNIMGIALVGALALTSCDNDDDMSPVTPTPTGPDFSGVYMTADQMGRPAINTVFVSSSMKDEFNVTPPSQQGAKYASAFAAGLMGLSPAYANAGDKNALGLDAATFGSVLATDVLTVSTTAPTTFYDGTNVLTGRNLADDVITVELLLIFGGEDFTENPTLSDDNVSSNDKDFSTSFPYLATPW